MRESKADQSQIQRLRNRQTQGYSGVAWGWKSQEEQSLWGKAVRGLSNAPLTICEGSSKDLDRDFRIFVSRPSSQASSGKSNK